jgi:hypothetical protein
MSGWSTNPWPSRTSSDRRSCSPTLRGWLLHGDRPPADALRPAGARGLNRTLRKRPRPPASRWKRFTRYTLRHFEHADAAGAWHPLPRGGRAAWMGHADPQHRIPVLL